MTLMTTVPAPESKSYTPRQILCAVTNPFVTVARFHSCRQEWVPDGAGNDILWRGDLQIAPRDKGFPVGSEDPPGTGLGAYISGTQQ